MSFYEMNIFLFHDFLQFWFNEIFCSIDILGVKNLFSEFTKMGITQIPKNTQNSGLWKVSKIHFETHICWF